jgi:hypothetical protein
VRSKKIVLGLLSGMCLGAGQSWGAADSQATQAFFASVKGTVTVKSPGETTERTARQDSKVWEGERVTTGRESSATLEMFDGSRLEISEKSAVTLSKLQRPSALDKVMEFKLLVGHLLAKVKKLASAQSSFEVEAGGVVCGVRGTQFAMDYHPDTHSLFLNVVEGSVFSRIEGGKELTVMAGQRMHFTHVPGADSKGEGGQNSNSRDKSGKEQGSNPDGQNAKGPVPGNPGSNPLSNPVLGDLNGNFQQGILVNCDNNLTAAQQNIGIRLHVGAGETVP